jgi:hypothetical protein
MNTIHYFSVLNKHKYLSITRKTSFKQDLIITCIICVLLILSFYHLVEFLDEKDFIGINFIFPILILDFCIRLIFKANPSVGILPYLCLPIKKQILISYILISDFTSIWIWGSMLVYSFILYQYDYIIFITFFMLILFNNYLIFFIKTLLKGYAILTFPIGLVIISIQYLFLNKNPFISLFVSVFLLFSVLIILNLALKHALYKELNNFAC